MHDQAAIDSLVHAFFSVFTNTHGATPSVHRLHDLFIAEGLIVKAVGPEPEIYSLRSFIEPRERMLTDGTLTDFEERETNHQTTITGNVAQRYSNYQKSGVLSGRRFETNGVKVMQFIRTPAGWRISAVAWDDEV